jgi:hypothetical protein
MSESPGFAGWVNQGLIRRPGHCGFRHDAGPPYPAAGAMMDYGGSNAAINLKRAAAQPTDPANQLMNAI